MLVKYLNTNEKCIKQLSRDKYAIEHKCFGTV